MAANSAYEVLRASIANAGYPAPTGIAISRSSNGSLRSHKGVFVLGAFLSHERPHKVGLGTSLQLFAQVLNIFVDKKKCKLHYRNRSQQKVAPMPNALSIRASLALAAASLLSGGCDLLDVLSPEGDTLITVFANHHATPEDGLVPDRGGDGELRVFENDEGWTVHLTSGVITTEGATLQRCDGQESAIELYFGAFAEDLRSADFDRRTLGGAEVGASEYCGVTVHYGPFSAETDEVPTDMDAQTVDGHTIFITGYAERGEDRVPFELAVDGSADVFVDLADRPEGALRVSGDEPFPVEVTISKTYDRFFDGVDFTDFDQADLEANAFAILELETRVEVKR